MADEPGEDTVLRRQQVASLRRLQELRQLVVRDAAEVPSGLSDEKLAAVLTIELLTALTRAELLLAQATQALVQHEETLSRDLEERIAKRRDATRWSRWVEGVATFVGGCLKGLATYLLSVANEPKVRTAFAYALSGLIAAVLGGVAAWWGLSDAVPKIPVGGGP